MAFLIAYFLMKVPFRYSTFLLLYGGLISSAFLFTLFIVSLKKAIGNPNQKNICKDPKIFTLVEDVSNAVGSSPFQSICLTNDLDISTYYIGRVKYLNLSIIALKYCTVEEMKAIIAHECAHYHHNAMLVNRSHNRAWIFYKNFENAIHDLLIMFDNYLSPHKTSFLSVSFVTSPIAALVKWANFLVGFCANLIGLYRYFLRFMGILINDIDYEYYCDSVAINRIGGNIFSYALQKLNDLQVAHQEVIAMESHRNKWNRDAISYQKYLENLENNFHDICLLDPLTRIEMPRNKSTKHPRLSLRLEKAQNTNFRKDLSEPLLSQVGINEVLSNTIFSENLEVKSFNTKAVSSKKATSKIAKIHNFFKLLIAILAGITWGICSVIFVVIVSHIAFDFVPTTRFLLKTCWIMTGTGILYGVINLSKKSWIYIFLFSAVPILDAFAFYLIFRAVSHQF